MTEPVHAALRSGRRYGELTVEELCADARIARSTFYTCFRDKDDLLRAIGADAVDDLSRAGRAWLNPSLPTTREELHRRVEFIVATYRRDQLVMRALFERAAVDEGIRRDLRALFDLARTELAGRLLEDQVGPDGESSAEDLAHWLTSMLDRGLQQLMPFDEERIEGLTVALADIFWSVLQRRRRRSDDQVAAARGSRPAT